MGKGEARHESDWVKWEEEEMRPLLTLASSEGREEEMK